MNFAELKQQALGCKTSADLLARANEIGMELSEADAKAYFDMLGSTEGELSDTELENVSGGGCHKDGYLVVTMYNCCEYFIDEKSGMTIDDLHRRYGEQADSTGCYECKYCMHYKGLRVCNNEHKCG